MTPEDGRIGAADRASRASHQAPAGLDHAATIPCASDEDIAFTRWFSGEESFSFRCERFFEECELSEGRQYRTARNWLRTAFQVGFEAAQAIEALKERAE